MGSNILINQSAVKMKAFQMERAPMYTRYTEAQSICDFIILRLSGLWLPLDLSCPQMLRTLLFDLPGGYGNPPCQCLSDGQTDHLLHPQV